MHQKGKNAYAGFLIPDFPEYFRILVDQARIRL